MTRNRTEDEFLNPPSIICLLACSRRFSNRLAVERKALLARRDRNGLTVADRSRKQHLSHRILQVALNHALEQGISGFVQPSIMNERSS